MDRKPSVLSTRTAPPMQTVGESSPETPKDAINCVLLGYYDSGLRELMDYIREKGNTSISKQTILDVVIGITGYC